MVDCLVQREKLPFHQNASKAIFRNAIASRQNSTMAEEILWMKLRNRKTGFKFRRQHPVGSYVVDFYCHKAKLVIEVDGGIHSRSDVASHDKHRTEFLENLGLKVVRFSNLEILEKSDSAVKEIIEELKQRSPSNRS